MSRVPPGHTPDERLRELLEVEARLQDLLQSAREEAGRRIAAAEAGRDRLLTAVADEISRRDAAEAGAEETAQRAALGAIDAAHRAAMVKLADLSESTIDELARFALARAIGLDGALS